MIYRAFQCYFPIGVPRCIKKVLQDAGSASDSGSGPAKETTQKYDWYEYDVGCFQSVCVFLSGKIGISLIPKLNDSDHARR